MTDDDKKEIERLFKLWLGSDEVEERVRKIVKYIDTEKYIACSNRWNDRIPFLAIGFAIGIILAMIATGIHVR